MWTEEQNNTLCRYIQDYHWSQVYAGIDLTQISHALGCHVDVVKLKADQAIDEMLLAQSVMESARGCPSVEEIVRQLPLKPYGHERKAPPPELDVDLTKETLSKPAEIALTNVNVITRAEVRKKTSNNRRASVVGESLPLYIKSQLRKEEGDKGNSVGIDRGSVGKAGIGNGKAGIGNVGNVGNVGISNVGNVGISNGVGTGNGAEKHGIFKLGFMKRTRASPSVRTSAPDVVSSSRIENIASSYEEPLDNEYMSPNSLTRYFQLEDTEDVWKELDSESEIQEQDDDDYLFKM